MFTPKRKLFVGRFQGPLTQEDIEEIEEGINMLVRNLFDGDEELEDALAMDLPDKIEEYIGIAQYAQTDPDLNMGPELEEGLRALLDLVKDYYHQLN